MAFNIERFGSNSSNIKSILGGVNRYYYYNKDGNTLTTPGYFPNNLGLAVGDRIQVVPKVKTDPEEIYVVSSIVDGVVTVTQIDTDGAVDSVNGKTGHVVLNANDVGAVPQYTTMPTPDTSNAGQIVEYVGATDSTYTNGYFYKNQSTPVYTGTVEFNPASISNVTATCSGNDFAALVVEWGSGNITDIVKGTLTYDQSGDLLVFVGQDDTNTQVCTFQVYTQDYIDAGFTFSGTLSDGDVITFTCTISESATYAWNRVDVQPSGSSLPTQTDHEGQFLFTNGSTASWRDNVYTNSTSKTYVFDENTTEFILRLTPKENRDCFVKIRTYEAYYDDNEGVYRKSQHHYDMNMFLPYKDLTDVDGSYVQTAQVFVFNQEVCGYESIQPFAVLFEEEDEQTTGGNFELYVRWNVAEDPIGTGETRPIIVEIEYSDGVDTLTDESSSGGGYGIMMSGTVPPAISASDYVQGEAALLYYGGGAGATIDWISVANVISFALMAMPGFDDQKTQTLKNVNGVLTWVDDAI